MTLGTSLKAHRQTLGYTKAQFGSLLGITSEYVGHLERDSWPYRPSHVLQRRLAQVLEIEVAELSIPSRARRLAKPGRMVSGQEWTLGARLAQRRYDLGLSQVVVARRMGVDATSICRWERDRTHPSAKMLAKLARALACSVARLRDGVGEEEH